MMLDGLPALGVSQSLLHQVTYSDTARRPRGPAQKLMSQSLLHQVTYSDGAPKRRKKSCYRCLNPFYIRSRIPTEIPKDRKIQRGMSQSLLHQVTYSDKITEIRFGLRQLCLNPFYIRSRIPTFFGHKRFLRWLLMSQSLLHQVTYSDGHRLLGRADLDRDVSIPFTSGHVFRQEFG